MDQVDHPISYKLSTGFGEPGLHQRWECYLAYKWLSPSPLLTVAPGGCCGALLRAKGVTGKGGSGNALLRAKGVTGKGSSCRPASPLLTVAPGGCCGDALFTRRCLLRFDRPGGAGMAGPLPHLATNGRNDKTTK